MEYQIMDIFKEKSCQKYAAKEPLHARNSLKSIF